MFPGSGSLFEETRAMREDRDRRATWEFPKSVVGFPGRLSLSSGVPVTTADVLAATMIYHTPYLGIESAEISVAVPATKYRLFDVFRYVGASGAALETVNWNQTSGVITGATNAAPIVITSVGHPLAVNDVVAIEGVGGNAGANSIWQVSAIAANTFTLHGSVGTGAYTAGGTWYKMNATTRATALTLQNGIYVKSTDSRRYLGTGCTTDTSGRCEDSLLNRLLWNYYNRVERVSQYVDQTNHTYNGVARYWNNVPTAAKHSVVIGIAEGRLKISTSAQLTAGVAGTQSYVSTAPNMSSTVSTFGTFGLAQSATPYLSHQFSQGVYLPEAFTFFPVSELGGGGIASTMNSVQSRIIFDG